MSTPEIEERRILLGVLIRQGLSSCDDRDVDKWQHLQDEWEHYKLALLGEMTDETC